MPELPEVEHVVRALRRAVVGRTIVASEIRLRKLIGPTSPAAFRRKLKNATIAGVSRRGKFILIELAPSERGHPARKARSARSTARPRSTSPDDRQVSLLEC